MNYQETYKAISYFLPYYVVIFMAVELLYLLLKSKNLLLHETRVNITCGLIAIITQSVLKTSLFAGLYMNIYTHRIIDAGNGPWVFVYCFFLFTFLHYIVHYLYHKVRLFWCFHEVHHSATQMNSSTGIRSSIFDVMSADALYFLIPFLGVPPIIFLIIYGCTKIWGNFIHINEKIVSRIPFINLLLVDPETHHIHHAKNIVYLDKNYGELIPWYDKLFGTYQEHVETPVYGTLGHQVVEGFWDSQTYEWKKLAADVRSAKSLRQKLMYIFMPPGWSPENCELMVKYLQKSITSGRSNTTAPYHQYGTETSSQVL